MVENNVALFHYGLRLVFSTFWLRWLFCQWIDLVTVSAAGTRIIRNIKPALIILSAEYGTKHKLDYFRAVSIKIICLHEQSNWLDSILDTWLFLNDRRVQNSHVSSYRKKVSMRDAINMSERKHFLFSLNSLRISCVRLLKEKVIVLSLFTVVDLMPYRTYMYLS